MPELEELVAGSSLDSVYSWQEASLLHLLKLYRRKKLAPGLLLQGHPQTGVNEFAYVLARYLLCLAARIEEGADRAVLSARLCGCCSGCHLAVAGSHPDLIWVYPQDSRQILVADVRRLLEQVTSSAQQGGTRIVIVAAADRLNRHASNALLKYLEEPGAGTYLLLLTGYESRLLATIRSRCQRVSPGLPDQTAARKYLCSRAGETAEADRELALQFADGNPLIALSYLQQALPATVRKLRAELLLLAEGRAEALNLARQYSELDTDLLLETLQRLLHQMIRDRWTQRDDSGLADSLPTGHAFKLLDEVSRLRLELAGPGNLNRQLALESLFLSLSRQQRGERRSRKTHNLRNW